MNDNKSSTSSGIGFTGLLAIAFIALKLLDVITWRWVWVWVLAPLWMSIAITVLIVIVPLIIGCVNRKKK